MPAFLVNYGGPLTNLTSNQASFQHILTACEEKYKSSIQSVAFTANSLDLTYYQVGIHRMIKVELPEQIEKDMKSQDLDVQNKAKMSKQLFNKARASASDFNVGQYKLLAHNCVTAVANVLNVIDQNILKGKKKVVPTILDDNIKNATLLQAMVDEALRGTSLPPSQKHKNYQQAHISSEIWSNVMTDVNRHQQKTMKEDLKNLHDSPSTMESKENEDKEISL
ncbi:hypothetical protein FOG18_12530 [Legionella israelensis]|uniref:hypothetical protein n=1 Tax=Legionella israelensis TaxID=454 RepID=UPI00117F484D|nr:hypothetical protein [Legionella israelensis]QDP73330.1 hypothetical protein FOG18_12530 [Legionella israelensis]